MRRLERPPPSRKARAIGRPDDLYLGLPTLIHKAIASREGAVVQVEALPIIAKIRAAHRHAIQPGGAAGAIVDSQPGTRAGRDMSPGV